MAERDPLEQRLEALASELRWPATPDLQPAVRAGIASRRRRRVRLLLLVAAVVAALAASAAAAASIGLRGVTIERVPRVVSPSPSASASAPSPGSPGARLELGEREGSLADAEAAAGFQALVPASLGQPDAVYYRSRGVITLVYRPRPGLPPSSDPEVGALVMEAHAVDSPSFGKLVDGGGRVEPVTVNGGPGFWITGAPHGFFLYRDGGQVDRFRLAGDVLIWNQAGLVVRIESGLDRTAALKTAGTVRRAPV